MISIDQMRREGSTADVVVFVQMSIQSAWDVLPDEDVRLLLLTTTTAQRQQHIQIIYLPKNEQESFYSIMLDKFRAVLSLTSYDRVVLSDGDVMLRGSLDYLCELSMAGILQKNVVFAGRMEPANGGLFMVQPTNHSREGIARRVIAVSSL
jgi:alpha-N-acetylglucosamine transferase